MRVVAIDQGTTSTRALVFEDGAPPRLAASLRHRQIYPSAGWVEHDAAELLANVRQCLTAAGPADVIGIANQGESCLAWDAATLEPLSPVIGWQDRRTLSVVERLAASGFGAEVAARAGLPLDCYFSATKLAWILEHCPNVRAARRGGRLRLGTTDSFFLAALSGIHATDATTASRTSLMNLSRLAWDPVLCEMFKVPMDLLAPILPTTGPFGECHGTAIGASVVDQQASLFGHGCRQVGDAKITFGTGAFALALTGPEPAPPDGAGVTSTVAWHSGSESAPPDGAGLTRTVAWHSGSDIQYALEGGVYDAGAAIEWAMRIGIVDEPDELAAFDTPAAIGRGLTFVPALSGLGCPQWSRTAASSWSGMTTATTRRDLQQSLLEGIALQSRQVIAAIDRITAIGDVLAVDGGLSASNYFLQFLADVTHKIVKRSHSTELTAYGCALLAGHPPVPAATSTLDTYFHPAVGADEVADRVSRYDIALQAAMNAGSRSAR